MCVWLHMLPFVTSVMYFMCLKAPVDKVASAVLLLLSLVTEEKDQSQLMLKKVESMPCGIFTHILKCFLSILWKLTENNFHYTDCCYFDNVQIWQFPCIVLLLAISPYLYKMRLLCGDIINSTEQICIGCTQHPWETKFYSP